MEDEGGTATIIPNCKGIIGLIRGHKFNTDTFDFRGQQNTDKCQRCGYRP